MTEELAEGVRSMDLRAFRDRARGAATSGTSVVLVGNVVARGLGLLFPIVVARLMNRVDFGLVYFFINTGYAVGEIVLTGFPTALTRQVASSPTRRLEIAASIVGGLPFYAAAIVAAVALGRPADADPALVAVVVTGLTVDAYYFAILRGMQRFRLLVAYRVGANAAQIVLVLVAAATGLANVASVTWIYSFVYLVPIVAIELAFGPIARAIASLARPSWAAIRALSRFALPALASGIAYSVLVGVDVYAVRLAAPDALPEYSAARAITLPMTVVPFGIGVVLMPRVATGLEHRGRLLRDAVALAVAFGIAATIGYWVLGSWMIGIVFPAALGRATGVVVPLAAAFAVLGVYSVLSQWWFGVNRPLVATACLGAGAAVTLCGYAVATPALGANGAAVSIAAGAAMALVLLGIRTVRALRS